MHSRPRGVQGAGAGGEMEVWSRFRRWGSPERPRFEGSRAFQHLERQCEFGPRDPGSAGHRRCLTYLTETLRGCGSAVSHQHFTHTDRRDPGRLHQGTNVVASFKPRIRTKRVLLCAHWDTRPYADEDPDPDRRMLPVPGANDGASGPAVLLEMARLLGEQPPPVGVDIALFDLEDLGDHDFDTSPETLNPFCIGSTYFAAHLPVRRPRFGILLDMVGKKDLRIGFEGYSYVYARPVVERVWAAAVRVRAGAFQRRPAPAIMDDHVPFLRRGIPVINVIDFDYEHWHTRGDTPDKCAAESLQQVGDVLVEVIYGGA